jgi:hypothetical protein
MQQDLEAWIGAKWSVLTVVAGEGCVTWPARVILSLLATPGRSLCIEVVTWARTEDREAITANRK